MPHKHIFINELISVCCLKDIETWGITSRFIIKNISAHRYKVIVPDHEMKAFIKISPPEFQVIGESKYTSQFRNKLLELLPLNKKDQLGWYSQQFIKLLAVKDNPPSDIVAIWDADTAPITHIEFLNAEGKIQYYKGTEHHEPYFLTIGKLVNLQKIVNFSFIAQCFPLKVMWLNELCADIENKIKIPWIDATLNQINFNEGNAFSEYETLGTFISHHHPNEVLYIDRPWLRLGNTLLNHVAFLSNKRAQKLSTSYDFISFEKWERAKPYFLKVTIPYFFKISLPKIFKGIFSRC
jgi:hypothetical protein